MKSPRLAGGTGEITYANNFVALVPGEGFSCNISFKSHREIFGWLPESKIVRLKKKREREKGRDYVKRVCKAVMKSQKTCDTCSVCDIFFKS